MNSVFNVRWPDTGLESRLKALALANRRSLQAEVLVALERHVALALPAVAPDVIREVESASPPPWPLSSEAQIELLEENDAERLERARAPRPSAVQVAKRSYTPDPK